MGSSLRPCVCAVVSWSVLWCVWWLIWGNMNSSAWLNNIYLSIYLFSVKTERNLVHDRMCLCVCRWVLAMWAARTASCAVTGWCWCLCCTATWRTFGENPTVTVSTHQQFKGSLRHVWIIVILSVWICAFVWSSEISQSAEDRVTKGWHSLQWAVRTLDVVHVKCDCHQEV